MMSYSCCKRVTERLPFLPMCSQESDYFTPQGEFRVDKAGSPTLLNCLMYKMSYYRFGEMQVRGGAKHSMPPSLHSLHFCDSAML